MKTWIRTIIPALALMMACSPGDDSLPPIPPAADPITELTASPAITGTTLLVLGTVQDAGSPQIGCEKDCCKDLWENPVDRKVVSLGIIDSENEQTWLFEASPDMPAQMKLLMDQATFTDAEVPDGIFLTHAHIGHYTGLMHLGREAMGASNVPVYAMPKMAEFLTNNGPWSQLITLENIRIEALQDSTTIELSTNLKVTPFRVPHRDEFSETVGYLIEGPTKNVLFIPDIDKWDRWGQDIKEVIKTVDLALLDATFYANGEIPGRDMSEIPHPFVEESMTLFADLPAEERIKIMFIHYNHTNPLLDPGSEASGTVVTNGYNMARQGDQIEL